MDIMTKIFERAKKNPQRVVFPEATNEKILQAARKLADQEICIPVLIGDAAKIENTAEEFHINLQGIIIADVSNEEFLTSLITEYCGKYTYNSQKTMKRKSSKDCMYAALMMEALDQADCMFAGIDHTTGQVLMAGQMVLGLKEGISTASSISIYEIPGYDGSEGAMLAFGDTAVCTNPSAEDLAAIAISSCETVKALMEWEPRCALLSYSTYGSGDGPLVDKVIEAVNIANSSQHEFKIEGEIQLDAAIDPDVARKKVSGETEVAGKANILICPDLNAGNIGSKIFQRVSKAHFYGPLLQGFSKIICDCTRGANVEDIIGNVAMSCVRAYESQIKLQ